MKKLLLLFLFTVPCFAAEDVLSVPDELHCVVIQTAAGFASKENVADVMANYPALRVKVKTLIAAKLDAESELAAQARLAKLAAIGVVLPQAVNDKLVARVEALRVKKEASLLTVKDIDPARAMAKMNELVAAGLQITKATKDAVLAKQPVQPVPVVPVEPNDGL